ncbi:hypothetical protein [Roseateles sp.]|uniref:hypothetical protein n=1 Tax=Roseateles sp. TaxID=1971397 RepID=UPI0025E12822|nr:hypothetical protein [Roseateles sp.]MBV8037647.1 hypothetical protein [Roseateles sp.]
MNSLWPWLALAGAGALHGLNPATGWALAACSGDARRALLPIALGHAAAVGGLALLLAGGLSTNARPLQLACGLLLLLTLALRRTRAGLALWSCLAASLHGSGLMLVPALLPLCTGAAPAREISASGSLLPALAAVAVHMAAMLAVTAVLGTAGAKGLGHMRRGWISILKTHDPSRRSHFRVDARPR